WEGHHRTERGRGGAFFDRAVFVQGQEGKPRHRPAAGPRLEGAPREGAGQRANPGAGVRPVGPRRRGGGGTALGRTCGREVERRRAVLTVAGPCGGAGGGRGADDRTAAGRAAAPAMPLKTQNCIFSYPPFLTKRTSGPANRLGLR